MLGEIVASNDLLSERANELRDAFDLGHALRLFQNDIEPVPKMKIVDFMESSYPGYARISMVGKWRPVFKVIDGQYQFSSFEITFGADAASVEVAHGWYLVGNGKVKLSCRLPFPNVMTLGGNVTVRIDCVLWAAVIL